MTCRRSGILAGLAAFVFALSFPALATEVICTAVADASSGRMLVQEGDCGRRVTPASTFKIAISLMGFDAGFLKDEHTPALPFRKGYADWLPAWRTTTDPRSWIQNSVVWYSQQVTAALGEDRFRDYVTRFRYGNEDVSGDPGKRNGLTRAWLSSSLQITPLEQIAFLEKLIRRDLPVSAHSYDVTSRVTLIDTMPDGWEVHGKTGTGYPHQPDGSLDEQHGYGWFVGWATRGDRRVAFARLIQDGQSETVTPGLRARGSLMSDLPAVLDTMLR